MNVKLSLFDYDAMLVEKCEKCKRNRPVVVITEYNYDIDDLSISVYCRDCFREEVPEYTLENDCLICPNNFKCNIQSKIFSEKETKDFKIKFWGDKNI